MQDTEWVAVFEGDGLQAAVVRAALDAAGFTVFGMGDTSVFPGLAFADSGVYVPAGEAERAGEFLRKAHQAAVAEEKFRQGD